MTPISMHSSLILGQAIPPNTTLGEWMAGALATPASLMVLVSGLLLFAGSWYLISSGKRPAAFAAYLVLLPLPVLIAICGCMSGMVSSLTVIAATPGIALSTEAVAGGLATSLAMVFYAILVSAPTYFVLAYGLLTRTLRSAGDGVPPTAIRSEPQKPLLNSGGPMPATT